MTRWQKKLIAKNLFIIIFACLSFFLINSLYALPNNEEIQTYRKGIHLIPALKQHLQEDINRYRNADDLWDALRQEFALDHYEDDSQVQIQIDWFMQHQDFLLNSANRAAPYLYYIFQQSKIRHLPAEVVLLPIIESAFNPFAYSPMGAEGIWQIMPNTASGYGIKQDWWYDGRRDIIISTKAALNHLSYLGNFFSYNWLLAFAAYDTGQGNVLNAIHKNIRDGYSTEFWALPLAQETREYVPRLLALAAIIAHPEKYPMYLPPVHNAPYLAQMDVETQIDLAHAAAMAGISLKQLMQLNPGYNRSTTSPYGPHKLILPIENVVQFSENLTTLPQGRHSNSHFYNFRTSLHANSKNYNAKNVGNPVNTDNYEIQPGDTIYVLRLGDDLEHIARRFRITKKALLAANPRKILDKFAPGERVVIPTHPLMTQLVMTSKENNYQIPAFTW